VGGLVRSRIDALLAAGSASVWSQSACFQETTDGGAQGSAAKARLGGVFRVVARSADVGPLDPVLEYTSTSAALVNTTCARLTEVAPGAARVSGSGRTYTFVLRSGFRFSDGNIRPGQRIRPGAQPRARTRHEVTVGGLLPRHRRRRRDAGREDTRGGRRHRPGIHAHRPTRSRCTRLGSNGGRRLLKQKSARLQGFARTRPADPLTPGVAFSAPAETTRNPVVQEFTRPGKPARGFEPRTTSLRVIRLTSEYPCKSLVTASAGQP